MASAPRGQKNAERPPLQPPLADPDPFTRCQTVESLKDGWNERTEGVDAVGQGHESDDRKSWRHSLLVLQVLVNGQEYLILIRGEAKQLTILDPCPAYLRDGSNLVTP